MTDYTALREAAALLDEHAASVRMTHTIGPAYNDWTGESEAKADHDRHAALASSLRSIEAELDALREKAARYDWLTAHAYIGECFTDDGVALEVQNTDRRVPIDGPVDAAIDAARKGES